MVIRGNAASVMRNRSLDDARMRANVSSSKQSLGKTGKYSLADLYRANSGDRASLEKKFQISNQEKEVITKSNYTELKVAAKNMQDLAKKLLNTDDDSIFSEALAPPGEGEAGAAEAKKKREDAVKAVSDFLDEYNDMVEKMKDVGGKVNEIFGEQLQKDAEKHKEALAKIGITINARGTLSVDQKTLEKADMKDLKDLFGTKGGFADKSSQTGKIIGDNAQNNINSLKTSKFSPNYNQFGNSYDGYGSGTDYNFLG